MSDQVATISYKGIFNRDTCGVALPTVQVAIERGRIQFFGQVIGIADPIHYDVDAARAAGHPDIVAPPSFFTVIETLASTELERLGHQHARALIGCDFRYLLHGDERYDYVGHIFAGDEISVATRIADFYDKKGGAMEFVTLEYELAHARRGVVLRATRTLLHRLG